MALRVEDMFLKGATLPMRRTVRAAAQDRLGACPVVAHRRIDFLIAALGFNFFCGGSRDALDPRFKT